LGQTGKGSGIGAIRSPIADIEPPAERRNLTHTGTCTERGKPVGLPAVATAWESEPQGEPMGLRVEDGGRSECLSVTGRIGVESLSHDCERDSQTTLSHAKAGRLPIQVARHEIVWRTVVGGKANDGGHCPSWCALQCMSARRLQACIVKL